MFTEHLLGATCLFYLISLQPYEESIIIIIIIIIILIFHLRKLRLRETKGLQSHSQ